MLGAKVWKSKVNNPTNSYNLWEDLAKIKANISFGQLIQLTPSLCRKIREGAIIIKQPWIIMQIKQIEEDEFMDLMNLKEDYNPIEIDVEIMDKIILYTIIVNDSNVNIMPLSIIEKLRLQITNLFKDIICTLDQVPCQLMG